MAELRATVTSSAPGSDFWEEDIQSGVNYNIPITLNAAANVKWTILLPEVICDFPESYFWNVQFEISAPDIEQWFNASNGECGSEVYVDLDYAGATVNLEGDLLLGCTEGTFTANINRPGQPDAQLQIYYKYVLCEEYDPDPSEESEESVPP